MREPAFEIRPIGDKGEPVGRIIRIYADGSVEGVDGGFIVFNRIPILVERGKHEERLRASQWLAGQVDTGKLPIVTNKEAGCAAAGAAAIGPEPSQKNHGAISAVQVNNDAKRKARNEAVDHIESFFDGVDRLFKEHFDPIFKRR